MRTPRAHLAQDAANALRRALEAVGCDLLEDAPSAGEVAVSLTSRSIVRLSVVPRSYVSPAAAVHLISRTRIARPVVVANGIAGEAKLILQRADWGYLDRRHGHLRIHAGHLWINDTTLEPLIDGAVRADRRAIRGRSGIGVAALLLLEPNNPPGLRPMARRLHMAPSSVAVALHALKEGALVRDDGRPLVPELFWELADVWTPRSVALADLPEPSHTASAAPMCFGLDDLENEGWAVGGTVATLAWGAPVTATQDYPPDFYVPSIANLRSAEQRYGHATRYEHRSCTVAVAPTRAVTSQRARPTALVRWPLADPLFVALDLSKDVARGHEILEDWTPPEPHHRVW